MKKKLYILGLVVILGLGGAYAIAGNSIRMSVFGRDVPINREKFGKK